MYTIKSCETDSPCLQSTCALVFTSNLFIFYLFIQQTDTGMLVDNYMIIKLYDFRMNKPSTGRKKWKLIIITVNRKDIISLQ